MSWAARVIVVFACVSAAMGLAQGQTIQAAHKTESSDFYPDNWNKGFDEAEPPSDAVLDALLKTQEAKEHWDQLKSLDRERLRKIFLVVRVHLTNFDEKDEVVLGSDPLSGADCDWFWVVRDMGGRANVLLFVNGLELRLSRRSANGYREIVSHWGTAAVSGTQVFSYRNGRYRLVYERSHENRP